MDGEDVLLFIRDAISFVTSSYEVIERCTPHIYLSALPFTPKDSLVFQHFSTLLTVPSIETFGIDYHARRCVMVIAGRGRIQGIAYSPDGKTLASSSGSIVQLWDIKNGAEIREFSTSTDEWITSIAFTPDSCYLIAGTKSGRVFQWDLRTDRLLLPLHRQYTNKIERTVVLPDGCTIACALDDGTIDVWSTNNDQPMCGLLSGHQGSVRVVAFSFDGKTLASGGYGDNTIRLWDYCLGEPVGEPLTGHQGSITCLAFSLDGTYLASGSQDRVVSVWDTQTGQQHRTYSGHHYAVTSVCFAPNGRALASGSQDDHVRIWNLHDGYPTSPLVLSGHYGFVNAVCFSNDGLYVASCSDDYAIRIWDVSGSYSSVLPLNAHADELIAVSVSGDSRLIASASKDGSVRVWDAYTCEQMHSLPLNPAGTVDSVAFSSDSRWIIAGSYGMNVRLWDVQTGQLAVSERCGHYAPVSISVVPSELKIPPGLDHVWNVSTIQEEQIVHIEHGYSIFSDADSRQRTCIAATETFGDIQIFDATTGQVQLLTEPDGPVFFICPLAFSPDGAQMIAPTATGIVDFDIRTRAKVSHAQGHAVNALVVAYSLDGRLIASKINDYDVCLWDTKTAEALEPVLRGHASVIECIVFSPDGRFLVTGSWDTTIRLWDLEVFRSLANQRERTALTSLALAQYKSGWLVSPTGDLLLWVPPEYQGCLEIEGLSRVIASRRAVVTADDGVLHQGEHWTRCWRAANSSGS